MARCGDCGSSSHYKDGSCYDCWSKYHRKLEDDSEAMSAIRLLLDKGYTADEVVKTMKERAKYM